MDPVVQQTIETKLKELLVSPEKWISFVGPYNQEIYDGVINILKLMDIPYMESVPLSIYVFKSGVKGGIPPKENKRWII